MRTVIAAILIAAASPAVASKPDPIARLCTYDSVCEARYKRCLKDGFTAEACTYEILTTDVEKNRPVIPMRKPHPDSFYFGVCPKGEGRGECIVAFRQCVEGNWMPESLANCESDLGEDGEP
jgi:hypothetical protein